MVTKLPRNRYAKHRHGYVIDMSQFLHGIVTSVSTYKISPISNMPNTHTMRSRQNKTAPLLGGLFGTIDLLEVLVVSFDPFHCAPDVTA